MTGLFDGPGAGLVAQIMARMNAEAEAEAIALLAPGSTDRVLVLGFGPGVGLQLLARKLHQGEAIGIDPSRAMMRSAQRRCRKEIAEGRVILELARADRIPSEGTRFDGAIAVNTLQLCEPPEATASELARVLRPGADLVTVTHAWAAARHASSPEAWLARWSEVLSRAGFGDIRSPSGKSEKGSALVLRARREEGELN